MPLVNAFLTEAELAREKKFPLDLYLCEACALVQLSPVVDPRKLFGDYAYLSSASRTNAAHLGRLASTLAARLPLGAGSKVLEIGSNDGTLLKHLARHATHVVGVDPARNLAALSRAAGVPTRVEFFSSRTAEAIKRELGTFDAVVAINVVAHTPDFVDLMAGARALLKPRGTFVVEVVDVLKTILRGEIDTIYHEHVFCFSLRALANACERVGLTIVDAQKLAVQGGSLRILMRQRSRANQSSARVGRLLDEEARAGVDRRVTYADVGARAEKLREAVRNGLRRLRDTCDTVVGLGAPARGVVLMNTCGLSRDDLDFVVDDTPLKVGKVVPGCHIPVRAWSAIGKDERLGCLMLSWNYRREVLAKLRARTSKARVLVPLPTLEEIGL
jgi:cyclopropane fatty-acyl-phospholipid synthase-like methyltransferase